MCDSEYDVILCASLDGTRIPAHRDVLSRSSLFFKAMFSSRMREATANEINMAEITGSTLNEVIKYCYTKNVTTDNMEILINTSEFFQFNDDVVSECVTLMSKNLCIQNCMNFVIITEKYGLKEFLHSSMSFIDLFFESMCYSDTFRNITVETLQYILKRDTLKVSNESIIFDTILKWYTYDKQSRKSYLPQLLKLIRLSDLDRTFISSFFLGFCTDHACVEMFEAASEFLSQDENILHRRSVRRLGDRIVAYNDKTIQVYSARTEKWLTLKYVGDAASNALTFEDRWMKRIEYYSPLYCEGYIYGVRKIQLTTRQLIFEKPMRKTMFFNGKLARPRLMNADWIDVENSMFYVVGRDKVHPSKLICRRYDQKEDCWITLPQTTMSLNKIFRIAYVDNCLYVCGAYLLHLHCNRNDQMLMCRYSFVRKVWETCPSLKVHDSIDTGFHVGIANSCIYVIRNGKYCDCFDPRTNSWKSVTPLKLSFTNIKICGTNRYLYVIEGESEKELKCVWRYDTTEHQWMELDSLNSMIGDFNILNVSQFY